MSRYLLAGILSALLASCSADRPPSESGSASLANAESTAKPSPSPSARRLSSDFASLPDRGELLSYDAVRQIKRGSAYTAYPVLLSEEHALRAMQTGEMVVQAPNGEQLRLRFERHVEHPDGNWTWIGKNAEGADAVLTFGEKAVFGSIPQGVADMLRITMDHGQAYLVATDRSKEAWELGVPRRRATDMLVPPAITETMTGASSTAAMRSDPTTAATTVVDVLVGYTFGLADQLGGTSQATTRVVNLVDMTNQAYVNSGVAMRVRLIGILKVNYPDNTDNGDALEKLTGHKSGSGAITPDPAFNALRASRDSKGADLVTLVRAFRTPENDGCGTAWLLGGGQSGISAGSAPFGYSVVSDGQDLDEGSGKTYFCREETFAHELGHNMGQIHNIEDSSQTGAHAYSYGFREASTNGFYTVMSYKLSSSSQFPIRHFANPSVSYAGRPTGVVNSADNRRSLDLTMPVVASFRAEVAPAFADVPYEHWAYHAIQSLYGFGITGGCGTNPLVYCPANPVYRSEMAVFLLRALHGGGYQPPAASGTFSDVPASHWAAPWIEQLAAEGVTSGCATNPLRYCPDVGVTRDQMAVFLLRAKHGAGYQPPAATGMFTDVPTTYWAVRWIEQLAREGVTQGCGTSPLVYCPGSLVTRDQMAVFLIRSFNL